MKDLKIYTHNAKYYETDQMGIIHHSNYIRWMEEARIDMMEQIGMSYGDMEKAGIISPVLSIKCNYKNMVHFNDTVAIKVKVVKYTGIKLELEYEMINTKTGEVTTTGESSHCFLDRDGKLLSLKKDYPEYDEILSEMKDTV